MDVLRILFPILMVIGALGSLVVNDAVYSINIS